MKKKLAFSVVTIITAATSLARQGDDFDRVRAVIRQQMTEGQIPSVAVAVARNGRIIWEEAFGWADRENLIPATPTRVIRSLRSLNRLPAPP